MLASHAQLQGLVQMANSQQSKIHTVFGGAGFIGSHLCQFLDKAGQSFAIVTPRPNFALLKRYRNLKNLIASDTLKFDDISRICDQSQAIYYLAGRGRPASYSSQPWLEIEQEVPPVFKIVSSIAEANSDTNFVYVSSGGAVYGNSKTPFSEDTPPRPVSAYGLAKLHIEEAIRFVGRTKGLSYKILRVTNPVGRHQTSLNHGLISTAVRKARDGQPIAVYGTDQMLRDYIDADELAEALFVAATRTDVECGTWNVGYGRSYSIAEVLQTVRSVTGMALDVEVVTSRNYDVRDVVVSVESFKRSFGWRATIDLQGIVEKIAWKEPN